ncbi:hypothetical protein [Nocardioides sp. B-3]|nr:hypothetical protein [Nocardioides sp. B-3]UUZ61906.1 hypothetical protein LP418_24045 [Nocardioides sp. B-3]
MWHRAAKDGTLEHARNVHVVQILTATRQQTRIFCTAHASTDQARGHGFL